MEIEMDSADTDQRPKEEICMDNPRSLANNPACQLYRYTSLQIDPAYKDVTAGYFKWKQTFQFFFGAKSDSSSLK